MVSQNSLMFPPGNQGNDLFRWDPSRGNLRSGTTVFFKNSANSKPFSFDLSGRFCIIRYPPFFCEIAKKREIVKENSILIHHRKREDGPNQ
jgi:hypothetical protein